MAGIPAPIGEVFPRTELRPPLLADTASEEDPEHPMGYKAYPRALDGLRLRYGYPCASDLKVSIRQNKSYLCASYIKTGLLAHKSGLEIGRAVILRSVY